MAIFRTGGDCILLRTCAWPGQAESEPEDLYQVVVGVKSSE